MQKDRLWHENILTVIQTIFNNGYLAADETGEYIIDEHDYADHNPTQITLLHSINHQILATFMVPQTFPYIQWQVTIEDTSEKQNIHNLVTKLINDSFLNIEVISKQNPS